MKRFIDVKAVLGSAILVRLSSLFIAEGVSISQVQQITTGGDAIGYTQLALNTLNEGTFKFQGGNSTAYRMPGYPLFLGASFTVSSNWMLAQFLQVIVDVVTVLLVFKLAGCVSERTITSILATTIVAINPLLIVSSISLLPDTLSVCLMALVMYILIIYRDSSWTNLALPMLLACSIYLKPTMLLVAVLFLIANGCYQLLIVNSLSLQGVLRFLFPLLILLVLLTPWAVRNYRVMGAFVPLTTSGGSNLYGGNNPLADGGYVSSEPYVLGGMSEMESDRVLSERAVKWVQANPLKFLTLLPLKAARFLWPLSLGSSGNLPIPAVAQWLLLSVMLIFYGLVFVGLWALIVNGFLWEAIVFMSVPIGLLLATLLAFGAARFALPAYPSFAILAALGIELLATTAQQTPTSIAAIS